MGRDADRIYNIITLFALLATVIAIIGIAVMLVSPPPPPRNQAALPTVFDPGTPTPITLLATFTETRTPLPPTFTPTLTETLTPLPSETPTASITPSPTITETQIATFTPTITMTPSALPTEIPTATPTGPTATPVPAVNPFPFDLREPVAFQQNFGNTFGCAWQGIGGTVVDLNGTHFTSQLQIHVFDGAGLDVVRPVGSNSLYGGPSGWEVKVADTINNGIYFVQLESTIGVQASQRLQIQFPSDCLQNVALLHFVQTRSLQAGPPVPPTVAPTPLP
jgi:hypothetical protein